VCAVGVYQYITHSEASCWLVCAPPAVLSSVDMGKHWAAAKRKRHEAVVCTNEADRPAVQTPALSEPNTGRTHRKHM